MCGIAGYTVLGREQTTNDLALGRMLEALCHRGPDGEGTYVSRRVALGHRRLAIIDLQAGVQPMHTTDGMQVITYNGEIYNYIELREELIARGHQFRTASDTEVILAAYREWGTSCVRRFNGMWAFALWDSAKNLLFCSRDRLGEKPFFYTIYGNHFVFGSEPKALFAFGVPRNRRYELLGVYLCLTCIPGKDTFFKDIWKLPPGHNLLVSDGRISTEEYWEADYPDERDARRDEPRVLNEFSELLFDAVRLRMRSDVPFGAFLSGGLDSSTIVAAMSKFSSVPLATCTIGFPGSENDETALAALVASLYRTDHVTRHITPERVGELVTRLAWHFDEPFGDSSALPTYIVSRIARERTKMVLTGDGGDEVLSGYTIFQGEKFCAAYALMPHFLRSAVAHSLKFGVAIPLPGSLKKKAQRAKRVVAGAEMDFIGRLMAKAPGLPYEDRKSLVPPELKAIGVREYLEDLLAPVGHRDDMTKLNYYILRYQLPDQMLTKVDRMTMANSLEARVPFLDHRIVELMLSVSMSLKLKGMERKHILRASCGRLLPGQLLAAGKRGFNVPWSEWLGGQNSLRDLDAAVGTLAQDGMVHAPALRQIQADESRWAHDGYWSLAMLAMAGGPTGFSK